MHSSQANGMSVRSNSNSPLGSREPRGQDSYAAWKTQLREQEIQANYAGNAMDIDYAPPAGAAANPGYAGQQYQGGPPANYAPAAYPPQGHPAAAQYPNQPGYGYAPNPPPAQYSPQPQTGADRYSALPPPPMAASYGQDPGAFVHGSNYQTAGGGYTTAGPNRMPPAMPHVSAAPSRTYNAPTAGTPVFGTEADPYGYPPPGNPTPQGYPTDALYGRGAYPTATTNPPEASSDVLGSPAGAAQRPGYVAPPEPQYDDPQKNPGLQSATTPTSSAPPQMPIAGAPPARRERDSEPRERERERDHRDHRTRRSEPERDDRHADRNRHRHR